METETRLMGTGVQAYHMVARHLASLQATWHHSACAGTAVASHSGCTVHTVPAAGNCAAAAAAAMAGHRFERHAPDHVRCLEWAHVRADGAAVANFALVG